MDSDITYKILREIQENPEISQRELAEKLGVSLGKTNYVLKALLEKGLLKMRNFRNNKNKKVYLYILTPEGMEQKSRLAVNFLKRKMEEYDRIKQEIEMALADANRDHLDIEKDMAQEMAKEKISPISL
ncbi:MAG: MarR family EPS-associated transcriptional regulator [Candidatus Hydrogenedentota bacterium]|nr:MAG: MarR family EPS-associated transcriptional regulator [Candidatus Hydrogenedentota bacterium]